MRRKKFAPPRLEIDYKSIEKFENNEIAIVLTNEILKQYRLDVDKTKIDNFENINFISIFE